ncbi:MAG: DsrE family protein [Desulfovibrionaceae bacterium]|nr:DsrE family protein [Desulfovibrionaceae bacterium]
MKHNLLLHVNEANIDKFKLAFDHVRNYRSEVLYGHYHRTPQEIAANAAMVRIQSQEEINIVLVVNGPAVQMLAKATKTDFDIMAAAKQYGVEVHAGEYSMKDMGLSQEDVIDGVKFLPVTLDIVALQQQGYAYIKM